MSEADGMDRPETVRNLAHSLKIPKHEADRLLGNMGANDDE